MNRIYSKPKPVIVKPSNKISLVTLIKAHLNDNSCHCVSDRPISAEIEARILSHPDVVAAFAELMDGLRLGRSPSKDSCSRPDSEPVAQPCYNIRGTHQAETG